MNKKPLNIVDGIPAGAHQLRAIDGSGDTQATWYPDQAEEVDLARQLFGERLAAGYMAYKVSGDEKEIIQEFDPSAKVIIMAPRMAGG